MPKSKSKSKDSQNHVRIRSKFASVSSISTATTAQSLGNIGCDATSILGNDVNLQSLMDIFRLFRVNSVTFHFQPASGASSAAVEVPSGFLAAVPYGINANPTAIDSAETPLVSVPTMPFGTTTTTTAPLTRETGTMLTLKNKDLPVLQGPGGGWLATQADGTQANYGALWWLTTAATAANTISYILRTVFDVSFKDLLDPALISSLMSRHPQGLPPHWEIAPGTPLHSMNACLRANQKIPPMLPGAFSACVLQSGLSTTATAAQQTDSSSDDDQLEAILRKVREVRKSRQLEN